MSSVHCYVCGELGHAHCDASSSAPASVLTQSSCSFVARLRSVLAQFLIVA